MNFSTLVNSVLKEQTTANDAATLGKTLGDPNFGLLDIPVSFRTQQATGPGMSYGNNVTLSSIIKNAQNNLKMLGHSPQDKQKILTQTANQLQDYFVGLNQDPKVPQDLKIDDNFRNKLMDMASKLNSVEKFIEAIKLPS